MKITHTTLLIICFLHISFAQTYKVTRIIDGDTYELSNGEKVRMIGIDAPELHNHSVKKEPYSDESKAYLESLILNKDVTLKEDQLTKDKDVYGRLLRYTYLNGEDINDEMISNGFADVYNDYNFSKRNSYNNSAATAKNKSIGMWQQSNAEKGTADVEISIEDPPSIFDKILSFITNDFVATILLILALLVAGYLLYKFLKGNKFNLLNKLLSWKQSNIIDMKTTRKEEIIYPPNLSDIDLSKSESASQLERLGNHHAYMNRGDVETFDKNLAVLTNEVVNQTIVKLNPGQLKADIGILRNENKELNSDIEKNKIEADSIAAKIDVNNNKILQYKSNKLDLPKPKYILFSIGTFILCGLSVYLWIFYTNAIYKGFYADFAFEGQTEAEIRREILNNAIFDTNTFNELNYFIIFAPIVLYAFGVACHYFFEYLRGAIRGISIFSILAVTASGDVLIATKIEDAINKAIGIALGAKNIPDQYGINFWIIIFFGLIVFILWSIIFHFVLVEGAKFNSKKILNETIHELEKSNSTFNEQLIELNIKSSGLKNQLSFNENKIIELELNGKLKVDKNRIESCLNSYFSGWNLFLTYYGFLSDQHTLRLKEYIAKLKIEDLIR